MRPLEDPRTGMLSRIDMSVRLTHPRMCLWMRKKALDGAPFPSIARPRSGNAKFAWRKVFDHDPRFKILSDKLAVRDHVKTARPDVEAPEILWTGEDPAEIPDDCLAGNVVVKTNHACATNCFVHDGAVDRKAMERMLRRALAREFGHRTHEWGYFGVPRKVFVERLVPGGPDLQEFKFYTYGRRIERVFRSWDRHGQPRAQLLHPDPSGQLVFGPDQNAVVKVIDPAPPPQNWDRLVGIARDLGAPFDHMRIDLLSDGDAIWFSEMTIYNLGGRDMHVGNRTDVQIARAWDLRRSWFLTTPQPGWKGRYAKTLRQMLDAEAASETPLPPA